MLRLVVEIALHLDPRDVVRHLPQPAHHGTPVPPRALLELAVRDPLAAQQVAQHGDVGGLRPPAQTAHLVREVPVVAPQVDCFSVALEPRRCIPQRALGRLQEYGAHLVEFEIRIAQIPRHIRERREDGRIRVRQRRVAFELGVAEREEAERRARGE